MWSCELGHCCNVSPQVVRIKLSSIYICWYMYTSWFQLSSCVPDRLWAHVHTMWQLFLKPRWTPWHPEALYFETCALDEASLWTLSAVWMRPTGNKVLWISDQGTPTLQHHSCLPCAVDQPSFFPFWSPSFIITASSQTKRVISVYLRSPPCSLHMHAINCWPSFIQFLVAYVTHLRGHVRIKLSSIYICWYMYTSWFQLSSHVPDF